MKLRLARKLCGPDMLPFRSRRRDSAARAIRRLTREARTQQRRTVAILREVAEEVDRSSGQSSAGAVGFINTYISQRGVGK